ncbi:MAG: hypothetical protein Q4P66_04875 [Actinomycetaceae bacterium]|nr:hypothetical protein [Actinomycetaceae bacterium]MDO5746977.1 hypothetical protein [Actinomycetaceae bacterium]
MFYKQKGGYFEVLKTIAYLLGNIGLLLSGIAALILVSKKRKK